MRVPCSDTCRVERERVTSGERRAYGGQYGVSTGSLYLSLLAETETAVTIFYSGTGRIVGEMGDNVIRVLTQMI